MTQPQQMQTLMVDVEIKTWEADFRERCEALSRKVQVPILECVTREDQRVPVGKVLCYLDPFQRGRLMILHRAEDWERVNEKVAAGNRLKSLEVHDPSTGTRVAV